ncbi:MAG: serine/threonine protein kinase [Kofleriaceae bacterium]|nr:serine/threonine protein kinase [Kofleriaceae bacterium]
MTAREGRTVGNYTLGDLLGRGGTSEVHAGTHRFLGDPVAIKLLRADLAGDDDAVAAFIAEATRARAIEHPNVVRVLDVGRDDASGRCYLVMERVDGDSLATRLARRGALDEAEARRLGAGLADGLAAAHRQGIVHRDLKPANVMLAGDTPKIVDFGIARHLDGEAAVHTSRRLGTPAYMAPEQLTGGVVAPCVDVWALGAVLFELMTGAPPFDGYADGRCPQLFEPAPRLTSRVAVSRGLDDLVARCLAREPGDRPASMDEVARALRADGGAVVGGDGDRGRRDDARDDDIGVAPERVTLDVADPLPGAAPAAVAKAEYHALRSPRRPSGWIVALGAIGVLALGNALVKRFGPDDRVHVRRPAHAPPPDAAPVAVAAPLDAAPTVDADGRLAIDVRTTPAGAEVRAEGASLGTTPLHAAVAPGTELVLRLAGHGDVHVRVEQAGPIDVRLVADRPRRTGRGRGATTTGSATGSAGHREGLD